VANRDDLEKLRQGPKIWNAWRDGKRGYVPDLRNANLSLSQRQLGPSNGGPIHLEDADLEGAELRNATLTGANLSNARLTGADLSHSRLDGANLASADLTNACLDHADLTGADLTGAVLIGASLRGVKGAESEQLAAAYGDASTVMPSTIPPPESWFPVFDDDFAREYPIPEPEKDIDLYEVLGVARNASAGDIRAAFRNLVKKLHPDINPGDAGAQEAFKKVSSAYRILNDPDKRARYDRGEIDSDGEVSAEYEAKRHFRRYAFRFYMAAAASLFMAVGIVGSLWYSVLTEKDSGRGRVELVIEQPKNMERLTSGIAQTVPPELAAANGEKEPRAASKSVGLDAGVVASHQSDAAGFDKLASSGQARADGENKGPIVPTAAKTEIAASNESHGADQPATASQTARQETVAEEPLTGQASDARDDPSKRIAALRETIEQGVIGSWRAGDQHGAGEAAGKSAAEVRENQVPPGGANPNQGQSAAKNEEAQGHHRPLREAHNGIEAAPAQGDTARSASPSSGQAAQFRQDVASAASADGTGDEASRGSDISGSIILRQTQGRRSIRDPISDLFRGRAVKRALPDGRAHATASIEPGASSNTPVDQEEVWDLYTHSLPEPEQGQAQPWPASLTTAKIARAPAPALPAPASLAPIVSRAPSLSENTPDRAPPATAKLRKQAVSDILSGGL
jgi:hypothetical protein